MGELNEKRREQFCQEFLVDLCAAKAARRAGYNESWAKQRGFELLQDEHVQARIAELQRERSEKLRFAQDDVLRELAIIVQSNVDDYVIDDRGNVSVREGLPAHLMRAVSSVKRRVRHLKSGDRVIETEFRLWDKPATMRMAGQHLGMFVEQHKHEHSGELIFVPPTAPPPKSEADDA